MKALLFVVSFTLLTALANANVRLAKIFGSGMVLQRNQPIAIWGWADVGENVVISFRNQTRQVKAGQDGKWKVTLEPESAGGPYELRVKGKNTLLLNDILVGDVWICSGQSNMEWPVSAAQNAKAEIAAANFPNIRHFKVQTDVAGMPKKDLEHSGIWKPATPQNVADFTAVGYFFARDLQKELGIPIGLINTTWGGTDIETWISKDAFENSSDFKEMIAGLGTIDLSAQAKAKEKVIQTLIKSLQGSLPTKEALDKWKLSSFNDNTWPKMTVPQLWEQQTLKDVDGTVWLRKTIDIAAEDAGKSATLSLAMIDDNDETYLNGVKIGATKGYNVVRSYTIPGGMLKTGKNVIAIRIEDTGGGGGVYGDAKGVALNIGNKNIPLAGQWAFAIESIKTSNSINPNSYPTLLYNAMIHPLIPIAMKGVIWYQGENNAGRANEYQKSFPLMINDWRSKWGNTNFPFYFVQLATFNAGNGDSEKGSAWAELREAQSKTLALPHTGMAVTTDIGDAKDIHPTNKQDVGRRLAAIALHDAYNKNQVYTGPTYKSMKLEENKIRISFSNTGSGLTLKDKSGALAGFEIAGEDQKFKKAKAFVEGNEVVVYNDEIVKPVAVRYNWADDAGAGNLFNKENFPAAPFRTDAWTGVTANNKYSFMK